MPGYYPRCGNCHTCLKCCGNGTVTDVSYQRNYAGKEERIEKKRTCPSCNGAGGKVGPGPHDHR